MWVNVDVLMTHDVCGPGTIGVFKREFGADAKVWDAKKVFIIPNHYIFTADSMSNRNVDTRTLVRDSTLREAGDGYRTRALGEVLVKGWAQPVSIHALITRTAAAAG